MRQIARQTMRAYRGSEIYRVKQKNMTCCVLTTGPEV